MYLTEDEAEELRLAERAAGRSQSELIREGVRHVIASTSVRRRHFYGTGKWHGGGNAYAPWAPDKLYEDVMGRK